MTRWAQVAVVLALLVLAVTQAAPVQDAKKEIPQDTASTKTTETVETEVKPKEGASSEEEKTSEESKVTEGAVSKEETAVVEGSGLASNEKDEIVKPNEEVTNYKDIEADEDNDVTNDNNEVFYTGSFDDDFDDNRLTEQDAVELLRELSDPAQVALFIMESDDVTGFLRSVQILLDQGFISEEYAFLLKETVSEELEQLVMMQDQEMYEDPLGLQTMEDMDMGNDYVDEMLNNPVPYFPEDYFDNTLPYDDTDLYPDQEYDIFQQPYSDETMALAEIANIIADQMESGEMSTERGQRIIDILSQLLPERFWQDDDISEEMVEDLGEAFANLYPLLPNGEQYQTFETEDDEPLPGGERRTEEEVVVDGEGRPVADIVNTEEEQEEGEEAVGDEVEHVEEELEKELMDMEPEMPDEIEKALQDVDKLATTDEETKEEEETQDDIDNDEWDELVQLLNEGAISDELLKELGLSSQDMMEITGHDLAADDEDVKP